MARPRARVTKASGVDSTVRELRLAAGAFLALDRAAQQRITREAKTRHLPMLGRAIISDAAFVGPGRMASTVAMDQRFKYGSNPGIVIGGSRALTGGARTGELIRPAEFGSYRELWTVYRGRRGGKTFEVKRRTTRQFRNYRRSGYFLYRAVAEVMPKVAAEWVRSVSEEIEKAMNGGRSSG